MISTHPTSAWLSTLALAALAVGGCAGGSWLESPSEADLPLDPPAHSYPTAVQFAGSPVGPGPLRSVAVPSSTTSVPDAIAPASASQPPPAAPPARRAEKPPAPPVANLAVLPAHLRAAPPPPLAPAAAPLVEPSAIPHVSPPVAASPALVTPIGSGIGAMAAPVAIESPAAAAAMSMPPSALASGTGSNIPSPVVETPGASAETLSKTEAAWIAALEAEIRSRRETSASDEELPRLEQRLRLAYLSAGRLDDAIATVDALGEPQREAYKHLLFGLGVWLSPDEARREPLRSAKVLRSLREATRELSAASKLELRNLAFCERVDYYGWYTEFSRNEFAPKQQVILYVEVDNFAAEHKSPTGYETELQGSYQIFDSSGQIVAERVLELDKEVCRNYRRDYFLAYRVYLPDALRPGRYRLELTIEDLKAGDSYQGRKFGEGMIEFTIR